MFLAAGIEGHSGQLSRDCKITLGNFTKDFRM